MILIFVKMYFGTEYLLMFKILYIAFRFKRNVLLSDIIHTNYSHMVVLGTVYLSDDITHYEYVFFFPVMNTTFMIQEDAYIVYINLEALSHYRSLKAT